MTRNQTIPKRLVGVWECRYTAGVLRSRAGNWLRKGPCVLRLWRDSHSGLRSSGTSPQTFR